MMYKNDWHVLGITLLTILTVSLVGCTNPNSPTNCLSEELNATYEKLEGVQSGDPDYAEAVKWSSICPEWGLL